MLSAMNYLKGVLTGESNDGSIVVLTGESNDGSIVVLTGESRRCCDGI